MPFPERTGRLRGKQSESGSIHARSGGPVWPDWENATFERHWVGNMPVDVRPESAEPRRAIAGPSYFWAGPCIAHFGHQIYEYSMRLRVSRVIDSAAKFVFAVAPGFEPRSWFFDVLRWLDIAKGDVILIDEPVLFGRLRVVPQMEWRRGPEPSAEFLDSMDQFIEQKNCTSPLLTNQCMYRAAGSPTALPEKHILKIVSQQRAA